MRITQATHTRDIFYEPDPPEDDFDDDCDEGSDEDGEEEDSEGVWCSSCDGTGIGQGDPDTSKCLRCKGNGVIRPKNDDDCEEVERGQL